MSKCNRNMLIQVEAIPPSHRRRGAEPCRVMDAIAFATAGPQNFATTVSESGLLSAFRTFVELRSARKPGRAGTMIASGRTARRCRA